MAMSHVTTRNAGISLSFEMIKQIDHVRGDVPRSIFVLRAVERALSEVNEKGDSTKK